MKDPLPPAAQGAATRDRAEDVRDTLGKARELYRRGRVAEAQVIMRDVLESQPRHHEVLHLSGLIEYRAENPRGAAELIGRAIEINPGLSAPHNNLGNALRALNQPMAAIESFDRAIAIDPNLAEAHFNRANALLDLNQLEAAVESYDRAIVLKPTHAEAHNNRGNALAALGRQQAAIDSYDRAVDLKPDYAMALNNRGVAYVTLRRPDAALADFDQAIALQPRFAMAHNNRGNALTRLGQLRAAAESYRRAIALSPKLAEPYTNLGSALVALGQPRAALQQIDRALELRPDYALAFSHRGDALRALLQLEAAIESYGRAMVLKPDEALFRLNQAIAKLQSGFCRWMAALRMANADGRGRQSEKLRGADLDRCRGCLGKDALRALRAGPRRHHTVQQICQARAGTRGQGRVLGAGPAGPADENAVACGHSRRFADAAAEVRLPYRLVEHAVGVRHHRAEHSRRSGLSFRRAGQGGRLGAADR